MNRMADNSWVETDPEALASNVAIFKRRLAPNARLGVVVKSNAYGHGAVLASRAFIAAGADWLIVNDVNEAMALRAADLEVPIYICGPVPPAAAPTSPMPFESSVSEVTMPRAHEAPSCHSHGSVHPTPGQRRSKAHGSPSGAQCWL